MIGQEIIEEKPVSLSEIKALLGAKKKDKELNYEQDIALKYSKKFSKLTPKESTKIRAELSAIESLKPDFIVKVMDILPAKKEVLDLIDSKSSPVPDEDRAKILEITKKYSKE